MQMAEASVTPDLCVPSRQKRLNTDYTEQLGGLCIEASRARRPQRTLLSSLTPHEASDKMRPLVDRRWLSAMAQESNERRSPLRSCVVLTFFLLVVYNSNFRWYLSRDSIPARVLPFSLLLDGHLYLDDWVEPYMQGRFAHDPYFVTPVRGHLYSVYPLIEPLTITPLYVLPAWWLRVQHPPFAKGSFALTFLINTMEKLSASLIAALSAGVLYLALRKLVAPRAALAITLVYALASNTWSTSSQSLWRQGFTELSFAILLWALLRDPASSGHGFGVGLALALAAANKPAYAVLVVLFFVYFARSDRKNLFQFCAPLAAVGALVLFYNVHFFGRLLGAYPNPLVPFPENSPMNPARFPWWHGFAGLLVSPNRGLFVYMPWTVFSFWGAARIWKENLFGWGRYLIVGMLAVYVIHARLGLWWGGGVYGPRYLCDLLPFFALLLVPVWPRIRFSRPATAVFVATVLFSFWVQVVGAYFYPNGYWDSTPASIESDPSRIWSWRDMQIVRTWKAGPDRPEILYEAPLFAQAVMFESVKPIVRLAVVGLDGDRSRRLFKEIAEEPAAELVAIADSNKDSLRQARGRVPTSVKFFDDYRTMLDEVKPDAVLAEAPTDHLEIVRECAQRGIDLALESPMAASAGEAREMESVASAAKIRLMVNYQSAWVAASQDLYGRVLGGAVGPVQKITVLYGDQDGDESGDEDGNKGTAAVGAAAPGAKAVASGGDERRSVLSTLGSDSVDWALWLKGRPSSVFAYAPELSAGPANATDNDAVILLQYPDATATLNVSRNLPYRERQVEVFGPKGSLLSTDEALFYGAAHTPKTNENPHGQSVELRLVMHETSSAVAYFIYHIQHEQPIEDPVSARMSVEVAEVLDAAKESIRTGCAVELTRK